MGRTKVKQDLLYAIALMLKDKASKAQWEMDKDRAMLRKIEAGIKEKKAIAAEAWRMYEKFMKEMKLK